MNLRILLFAVLLLAFGALSACVSPQSASSAAAPQAKTPASLRLMTFNIRYGSAEDGVQAWPARRQLVAELIRRANPDVLAVQEGLAFQLEDLADVLSGYRKLGQHRDGGLRGEFSGLYVREANVQVMDWGELWLSPTPQQIASRGWDAALPRMAVWVDLAFSEEPVLANPGTSLRVYGTHFDHRGVEARLQSARLLVEHARSGPPAIFMGDFNAEFSAPPLQTFVDASYTSAVRACDPFNTLGTFNGFLDADGGRRIDYILCAPAILPLTAQIHADCFDGIWPSDHFPVSATVQLGP